MPIDDWFWRDGTCGHARSSEAFWGVSLHLRKQHRNSWFIFFLILDSATSWGDPATTVATCTQEGMPAKGCPAGRRKQPGNVFAVITELLIILYLGSDFFVLTFQLYGKKKNPSFIWIARFRDNLFLSHWLSPYFWLLFITHGTNDKTIFISLWFHLQLPDKIKDTQLNLNFR